MTAVCDGNVTEGTAVTLPAYYSQSYAEGVIQFQSLETLVSIRGNFGFIGEKLQFHALETKVARQETKVFNVGNYRFSSMTSRLAPSLQVKRSTVCFLSTESTLQNGVSFIFHCPFNVTVTGISPLSLSIHGRE